MTRIVIVDPDSCVACRQCEFACALARTGDFDRRRSHIRVNFYPDQRVCLALTCLHCDGAWCLEVCPAAAISRDPATGAIVIDQARCAGCKMCLLACPYGSIHFDAARGVSEKCDLCGGDPECVVVCGSDALRFLEPEEVAESKREAFDWAIRRVLRLDKAAEK